MDSKNKEERIVSWQYMMLLLGILAGIFGAIDSYPVQLHKYSLMAWRKIDAQDQSAYAIQRRDKVDSKEAWRNDQIVTQIVNDDLQNLYEKESWNIWGWRHGMAALWAIGAFLMFGFLTALAVFAAWKLWEFLLYRIQELSGAIRGRDMTS